MGSSLTIFKLFGIDVKVHWSFLLILVYGAVAFSGSRAGVAVGALYGVVLMLLIFFCVTLHELGHSVVAQNFKIKVNSIMLLPIGGVATMERMPDEPWHEFLIAIAGPAVNFLLALILLPVTLLAVGADIRSAGAPDLWTYLRTLQEPGVTSLLTNLLSANILLALFNLLPAFPMDGGRILRALLALAMPYVKATRMAVMVGRIMAVLLAIWGVASFNVVLMLIAFFVYVGGGAELDAIESRIVLKNIPARRALTATAASLYTSERISRAVDLIMNSYQTDYPVLDLSGKFVGVLTRGTLVSALRQVGQEGRIVDVMIPAEQVPITTPNEDLAQVWEMLARSGSRVVAVKENSEFLGLITLEDITELIHVIGATQEWSSRRSGAAPIQAGQSGASSHDAAA